MSNEIKQAIDKLDILMVEHNVQLDEKTRGRLNCILAFNNHTKSVNEKFLNNVQLGELYSKMGNSIRERNIFLELLDLWITRTNQFCMDVVFSEVDEKFDATVKQIEQQSKIERKMLKGNV